jgi:hypothetical protein
VEAVPPPLDRDHEFQPPVPVRAGRVTFGASIEEYQRLVANPFLGLIGFAAWLFALRWLLMAVGRTGLMPTLLVLVAGPFGFPYLFHYHCLDCGATGLLHRYRKHSCATVAARLREGRVRSFRGPTPFVQVVIWLYVLLALAIVVSGVMTAHRG